MAGNDELRAREAEELARMDDEERELRDRHAALSRQLEEARALERRAALQQDGVQQSQAPPQPEEDRQEELPSSPVQHHVASPPPPRARSAPRPARRSQSWHSPARRRRSGRGQQQAKSAMRHASKTAGASRTRRRRSLGAAPASAGKARARKQVAAAPSLSEHDIATLIRERDSARAQVLQLQETNEHMRRARAKAEQEWAELEEKLALQSRRLEQARKEIAGLKAREQALLARVGSSQPLQPTQNREVGGSGAARLHVGMRGGTNGAGDEQAQQNYALQPAGSASNAEVWTADDEGWPKRPAWNSYAELLSARTKNRPNRRKQYSNFIRYANCVKFGCA